MSFPFITWLAQKYLHIDDSIGKLVYLAEKIAPFLQFEQIYIHVRTFVVFLIILVGTSKGDFSKQRLSSAFLLSD
jgi:hypothetical protein